MRWFGPNLLGKQPAPRYNHSATSIGNSTFVFGGFSKGAPLNDVILLDEGMPKMSEHLML